MNCHGKSYYKHRYSSCKTNIQHLKPKEKWNNGAQPMYLELWKHNQAVCFGLIPRSSLDQCHCPQNKPCDKWAPWEWVPPGEFGPSSPSFAFYLKAGQLRSPNAFYWWDEKSLLWFLSLGPLSSSNLWLSPHSVREGAKLALKWGLQCGSRSGQTDVPSKSV